MARTKQTARKDPASKKRKAEGTLYIKRKRKEDPTVRKSHRLATIARDDAGDESSDDGQPAELKWCGKPKDSVMTLAELCEGFTASK